MATAQRNGVFPERLQANRTFEQERNLMHLRLKFRGLGRLCVNHRHHLPQLISLLLVRHLTHLALDRNPFFEVVQGVKALYNGDDKRVWGSMESPALLEFLAMLRNLCAQAHKMSKADLMTAFHAARNTMIEADASMADASMEAAVFRLRQITSDTGLSIGADFYLNCSPEMTGGLDGGKEGRFNKFYHLVCSHLTLLVWSIVVVYSKLTCIVVPPRAHLTVSFIVTQIHRYLHVPIVSSAVCWPSLRNYAPSQLACQSNTQNAKSVT